MKNSEENRFFDRIVEGKEYYETVTLTHKSGDSLEGVEIHQVDKQQLAATIERLPEEMFDAMDEAETPEEAEEMLAEGDSDGSGGIAAMNAETVAAFEELLSDSLRHENMTNTQMDQIIEALDFEMLFELGGRVMDISFENSGSIKDFQEQQ